MNRSLSELVDNLSEPGKNIPNGVLKGRFYNTYQLYPNSNKKFELLLRKGVYTYEYMDSWDKFNKLIPLDKKYYYSELNDADMKKNVCNTFKMKTLGEYHDLYVKSDTALLADIFENFRDKCLDINKLDPACYLSATGLSWHSCLKKTGVKLKLLTDNNMLLQFEKGIRSGIATAVHKYAKVNNRYMKNYDSTKQRTYLMYVDANNLFGYAMRKKLPVDNFKWGTNLSIFTEDFIKNNDDESDTGYLLFVDVIYPKNPRKKHKYLPFLPEKVKRNKVIKLTCEITDKNNYSVSIFALKQALNHGLILKKVHSVISFRQKAWLKPYIDINTQLRTKAANEFEKDFYKLCNNIVYGKTMEHVRKHRDIRLVKTNKKET